MTSCAVAISERQHDQLNARNSVHDYFIAAEQIDEVGEAAKKILAGHKISDSRSLSTFDENGHHTTVIKSVTFSMRNVVELVSERLTPLLCAGLLHGEPSALSSVQQIINEAANEIAFDALDLWSNPFVDYEDLKSTAEQA